MHPLSIFPTLLSWGLIGPTLLRVFIGLFLIFLGRQRWFKSYKWSFVVYLAVGILIGMGLYTQVAALVGCAVFAFEMWADKKSGQTSREKYLLYTLCIIVLITLLFTGPGFFAFDLPL